MKKLSILLIALILLATSGCWDKQELEDNTFAVLLGIDTPSDDTSSIVLTVAFPKTQTQGGGPDEGVDNGSGDYCTISVKALTVAEGLNMISKQLSGPLAPYSVKTVIVSQATAQDGLPQQLTSIWKHDRIRSTAIVLISECDASEFINARINNSPIDPMRQEELLLEESGDTAGLKPVSLLELITNLTTGSGDGIAIYGGVAAKQEENSDSQTATEIKGKAKHGYLPQELPIQAENKSRISGLAVFHNGKMTGVLDSQETLFFSILAGDTSKKMITVPDPQSNSHNVTLELQSAGKYSVNAQIIRSVPVFDIEIGLKYSIKSTQSQIDYSLPQNRAILSEHVRNTCLQNISKLIEKTQTEFKADILNLGNKLRLNFATVRSWDQFSWDYNEAVINCHIYL